MAAMSLKNKSAKNTKKSVRVCRMGLRGPVGVGWCACDKENIYHIPLPPPPPPGWRVRRWGTGVRTLSDLWGGVSGHGVNVHDHDQCGVCDDVTVRRGWMGRSRSERIFYHIPAYNGHGKGLVGVQRGCMGRVLF